MDTTVVNKKRISQIICVLVASITTTNEISAFNTLNQEKIILAQNNKSIRNLTQHTSQSINFRNVEELDNDAMAEIEEGGLRELSGMVPASRALEYWGVNDKGNAPELFRFVRDGRLRQRVMVHARNALGDLVRNNDWEAMTMDDAGNFYIGGFGDNNEVRNLYWIYQLQEPGFYQEETSIEAAYPYRYSDGQSHNCEAMFLYQQSLYFITKVEAGGRRPKVFRLQSFKSNQINIAKEIGEMAIEHTVTDAAYYPKLSLLAVLCYDNLFFYHLKEQGGLLSTPALSIKIDFDQCEALCFDENHLIITNEDGEIWWHPIERFIE